MADKKIKLDTLSQQSKKKKDFLIFMGIGGIVALVGFSIFSFSLDVDKKKTFQKRSMEALKSSKLQINPKENIKESWAISVEESFKEQNKVLLQFMKEVKETRKENQKELTNLIDESQKETEGKIFKLTEEMNANINKIRKEVKEALLKQDNRIQEIKLMNRSGTSVNIDSGADEEEILLGDDLLPKIDKNKVNKDTQIIEEPTSTIPKVSNTPLLPPLQPKLKIVEKKVPSSNPNLVNPNHPEIVPMVVEKKIVKPNGEELTQIIEDDEPVFIDEVSGEKYKIKQKDNKDVIVDEKNIIIDTKKYAKNSASLSYTIIRDRNGEPVILNKKGKRLKKLKDFNDKDVLDDDGDQVFIDPETGKTFTVKQNEEGKLVIVNDQNKVLKSSTDKNGNTVFANVLGQKLKKKKVSFFKIDTQDVKQYALIEKRKELHSIKKRMKAKNTYHIMTGLTTGFLITGVYAPAFSEGKMEPLPVLIQAEGEILIANDDTEDLGKCFFLGSAKGNMNSETADIRLNKVSCSLADGTKKIEGSIAGWVIGENGIPGVPGQLLHKNGAWLAKTFVAGFLDTFSQTLVSYAGAGGKNGSAGNISIGDSLAQSGAQSSSDVFQKIGDYYLQMAEQIFPIIEVKPGRTVDILLKGGDVLTVTDFHSAKIDEIESDIKALEAQKAEDEERLKAMDEEKKIKELDLSSGKPKAGRAFSVKTKTNDLFSE